MLSAVNLSRSYAGVPVVRGASIEVGRGQIHALVGENGAGKSTMLRMIAGLVQPDSGTVEVDGEALQGAGRRSALRAGIAMVTQELAAIPARTVVENVFLGHRSRPAGGRVAESSGPPTNASASEPGSGSTPWPVRDRSRSLTASCSRS